MKAKTLKKFIEDNEIEWHKHSNENEIEVYLMPYFWQISDLCSIFCKYAFDDDGIECVLKNDYLVIPMANLLESNGIEIDEVFKGEDW